MKKLIALLSAVLITASIWAQSPQKMSYQAVIRDASNTLVTNTAVGMKISILQATSTGTAVYEETQTPTTNANGLVSIEIGGGTVVSGTFNAINWANGPYFIKTETDPAGGTSYSITGTSQLLSVPYALSAGNVTGLEKITEGSNSGWRLVGRDPANYGDIGFNATDLSYSSSASTTLGATGAGSLAMGENTTASSAVSTAMGYGTTASYYYTTAMGRETTASNWYSTAMGYLTTASGDSSTSMGNNTTASGYYTTAMGNNTTANALASTAIGRYNIGGGSTFLWTSTDPLFEIGNGTSSTPSNALTVLKNGTITAPSFDLAEITDNKALITKEYADANLKSTGLEVITEGGFSGRRLIGQYPANYGNIGYLAVDLSNSTSSSSTHGATNNHALATGFSTTASGIATTAMGQFTKAESYSSTAIGAYNIGGGNATTWVATDPLFEIGNSQFGTPRSNALTVLKNGNTGIATSNPTVKLQIGGTNYASLSNGSGLFVTGNETGLNLVFDTNEIMARNNGSSSPLYLQNDGGDLIINNANNGNVGIGTSTPSSKLDVNGVIRAQNNVWPTTGAGVEIAYDSSLGKGYVQSYDRGSSTWKDIVLGAWDIYPINDNFTNLGISTNRWTAVYAVNGTIQTSDRRMKKDINNLNYGLNTVLKLRPVSYKWKKGNQNVNLGLIAQEVQKLIPEVVDVGTDKDKTLGMKYTELIPVLINAIKEQQKEITELKKMVNKLLQKKYW